MQDNEAQEKPPMTIEDRLKAVAYQFMMLYERWSEDRQVAAKQGDDIAAQVKLFTEQVQGFKELEPKVRRHIAATVAEAAQAAGQKVGEKIEEAGTRQMDASSRRLQQAVNNTIERLNAYEMEKKKNSKWERYFYIGSLLVVAILVGLFVGRYAVSNVDLINSQLDTYQAGRYLKLVWPKLSKKEQERLHQLATGSSSDADGSDGNNGNNRS